MFSLFDFQHIGVLLVTLVGIFCLKNNSSWRRFLAWGLALQFVTYHIWNVYFGTWKLNQSLPFHLSSMAILINIVSLNTNKNWFRELAFYWTIFPASLALLLPDLQQGWQDFRFWEFFWSHILMLWAALLVAKNTKFSIKGLHISFAIVLGYVLFFALPINLWLGTNYAYIVKAPDPVKNLVPQFPYFVPIFALALYLLYWVQFLITKFFMHAK